MTKEYTTLRKTYAWIGFFTVSYLVVQGITWLVDAHIYIASLGY